MHRVAPLVVAALAVAAAGSRAAGEALERRGGRAVRVEKPRTIEVFVPAGMFTMGVTEDGAASAVTQCQLAYFPPNSPPRQQIASGQFIDFCSEYYVELTHMQERDVYLDAFAIDRDEVIGRGLSPLRGSPAAAPSIR